jgi:hypothetical protein
MYCNRKQGQQTADKKYDGASDLERHFTMRLEALTVVLFFCVVMLHHN